MLVSVALAAALVALHTAYPLPYVYRVMAFQDADFEDIHRFPARAIAAPEQARQLPVALDRRVSQWIERYAEAESLADFLTVTETSAFLVAHDGELIEERYSLGHDQGSFQNTFSISKSITSALVGLAVADGAMSVDSPITRWLHELESRDRRFSALTVDHLLDMRSGIRYSSEVNFPFVNADNALIYYHTDLESMLLRRVALATEPGEFQYNNYNPPLLGLALRRATGRAPSELLQERIWDPMGAADGARWTVDNQGVELMESGFHARARDLVRFGLLYLAEGAVGERQVLPAAWVRSTTSLREPAELEAYDGRAWGYRGGWWIMPRAEGREDFCAIGRYGQFIYVSPQYETVIVRNGPGRGSWGDRDWTEMFYALAEELGATVTTAGAYWQS